MNTPSILLVQDQSIYPFDLDFLSDQTIMEIFIDQFPGEFQATFKHPSGDFKDVCKWKGIKCNGRRRVEDIYWDNVFPKMSPPAAHMQVSLDFLPPLLERFFVFTGHGENRPVISACIDTSALPRTLNELRISFQEVRGSIDYRRLPPHIQILDVGGCNTKGTAHVTSLPKSMISLFIAENRFTGSLHLHRLPPKLEIFDAQINCFSGSINLCCLPSTLVRLDLADNELSGNIYLEKLPRAMVCLFLGANHFCGEVQITKPPPKLETLSLQDNDFEGTAVIARAAFDAVQLDDNQNIVCAVDERGNPCKIPIEGYSK